jgi:hypothetical protein
MNNPAYTVLLQSGERGTMARQTYLTERWRYQPVWVPAETGGDILVVFRCVFDEDGKLLSWDEDQPQGDSVKDLARDLAWMMRDVYEWEPVTLDDDVLDHLEHAREFAGAAAAKRQLTHVSVPVAVIEKAAKEAPLPAGPGTNAVHDAEPMKASLASLDAAGMEDSKGG